MERPAARGRELDRPRDDLVRGELDIVARRLPNTWFESCGTPGWTRCCARPVSRVAWTRDHLELAGSMIDMSAGAARCCGSRLAYLRGGLLLLEFALVQYALAKLVGLGFEPVISPVLVASEALIGTASSAWTPSSRSTGCPTTTSTWSGPRRWRFACCTAMRSSTPPNHRCATPASPCFRREAGAAGSDSARHLPRARVRQAGDVHVRRAR